jgi:hypothetical protein
MARAYSIDLRERVLKYLEKNHVNYDTLFIGFFPLALSIPLIHLKFQIPSLLFKTALFSVIGIVMMIALAYTLDLIQFDLKFLYSSLIFLIVNLFFSTIKVMFYFYITAFCEHEQKKVKKPAQKKVFRLPKRKNREKSHGPISPILSWDFVSCKSA